MPPCDPRLQKIFDAFEQLPECQFKGTMRGMLQALPAALEHEDAAKFTLRRLRQLLAEWRAEDALKKFDEQLRSLQRQIGNSETGGGANTTLLALPQ